MNNYDLAKKIVSSKYDSAYEYYPLFVLSVFALLNKYPDYQDIIYELFRTVDIYLEDKSLYEIAKEYDINVGYFDCDEEKVATLSSCFGMSSQGYSFVLDEDNSFTIKKNNPFIICNTKDFSVTFLLNLFIHEFNHLIKGYYNSYKIDNDNFSTGYYLRSGLDITYTRLMKYNDTLYEINYHSILDEVINTIQTTEMMQEITKLDGIILDDNIQVFIAGLNKREVNKDFGYDLCVKAFRPLWNNDCFKSLIEDNIVSGNIKYIGKKFDEIIGVDVFEEMCNILDNLDELEARHVISIKKIALLEKLKGIINNFNKKTTYVYKK